MSKTVDEKVVEMKFNNQNFEKNVSQSMNSIDKLKGKLDFKGTESKAANSMSKISSAANNIKLDGMAKAIETVNYRFSTMGIVATNIINQITNMVTGKLSGAFNMLFGQIKSGGLSRAMNLERANFQLENLLKDEKEVEGVMKNVNDAVDGTAYGLDAAAVVASQLTASGARAGDQLYNQLRAIAGVAAMTGASYEEIGNIFTTVAGNGRLLSMQLLQLSSRGLNVAAIMSKQMNMTEEEFRKKVSESQITYQQFADAMVKEFGEAAGKANETFDGALSNVKAALSRIGAKFYSPGLIQARDILNELRLAINAINKALDPLINSLNGTVYVLSKKTQSILKDITADVNDLSKDNNIVSFLDSATKAFSGFSNIVFGSSQTMTKDWWNSIKNSEVGTENFIFAIKKAAKEFDVDVDSMIEKKGSFENTFESGWFNIDILKGAINSFGTESDKLIRMYDYLQSKGKNISDITSTQIKDIAKSLNIDNFSDDLVKKLKDIEKQSNESGKSVTDTLKEINEAEQESNKQRLLSMGYTEEQINELRNLYTEYINGNTKVLNNLTEGMDPTNFKGAIDYIINSLSSIASIFNSVFQYIVKAFDSINDNNSIILEISSVVSDLLSKVSTFFKTTANENNRLVRTFSGIIAVIKILGSLIKSIISGISNIISGSDKLGGSVLDITAKIGDKLVVLYNFLRDTQIFDRISNAISSVGKLALSVLNGITKIISTIFGSDSNMFVSFGKAITSVFNAFFGANQNGLVDIVEKITEKIDQFTESISKKDGILSKIGDKIRSFFYNIAEGAKNLTNGFLKTDVIGSLVSGMLAIGVTFEQLYWRFMAMKKPFDVLKGLYNILKNGTDAVKNFTFPIGQLGDVLKQFQNGLKADILLKTAGAIALMAGSLYLVSTIPADELVKAGVALTIFAGLLLGATKIIMSMSKTKASPINWKQNGFINGLKEMIFQFKDLGQFVAKINAIGNLMLKLSASILLIAYAFKIIAEAVREDPSAAAGACLILIVSIASIVGAVLLLDKFATKDVGRLKAIGTIVLALSASIWIMAEAFKVIANSVKDLDAGQTAVAILILVGSIAAIVVSVIMLDKFISSDSIGKLLTISLMMAVIGATMVSIGITLAIIAGVVHSVGWEEALISAGIMLGMLFVVVGLIAALGALSVAFTPAAMLAVTAALAAAAVVLLALAAVIAVFSIALGIIIGEIEILTSLLSGDKCGAAWAALGYLAVLLITLAVGLAAMTFGIIGVGVLLLLADALKTLIPMLYLLAALPSDDIWSGIGKIAQALLGFLAVGLLAVALSPILLGLSIVLGGLGIALTLVSAAMYIFVSAFTALTTLTQISAEVITNGMGKIADGIHNLIMKLLDHVDEFVTKVHDSLLNNAPKIKEIVKTVIQMASDAVREDLPALIDTVVEAVHTIANKLHLEGVINFITAIRDAVNKVFQFLADIINGEVNDEGGKTAEEYGNGLYGKVSYIANRAIDIFVAFCNALSDTVDNRKHEIVAAALKLGNALYRAFDEEIKPLMERAARNIMDGLISKLDSFMSKYSDLYKLGKGLGELTIDAYNAGTDSASPSKKAIKAAQNVINGLFIGLRNNQKVLDVSENLGNSVVDKMKTALDVIQEYASRDYSIEPTIAPVLDMNGVTATADEITQLLSGNTTFGLAASVNAKLNQIQNEDPYYDITRAINTLHNDLQELDANNYTINGVTYDDGSNVANAVGELISAVKVGRRA